MVIASEIIAWTALCGCTLSFFISFICVKSMNKMLSIVDREDLKKISQHDKSIEKINEKINDKPLCQVDVISVEEQKSTAELNLINFVKRTQLSARL